MQPYETNPKAWMAIQVNNASLGIEATLMREQIMANLSTFPRASPIGEAYTYEIVLLEHQPTGTNLLQYSAAITRTIVSNAATNGPGDLKGVFTVIVQSKRLPVVWGVYRELLRWTSQEAEVAIKRAERPRKLSDGSQTNRDADLFGKNEGKAQKSPEKGLRILGLDQDSSNSNKSRR